MDVATIQMDPAQAREKLKEYRGRKHRAADAEYQAAEIAYTELAKGTPLVILSDAIQLCPRDAKGRPMLAIARADRQQVQYVRDPWRNGPHRFNTSKVRGVNRDLDIEVAAGANETDGNTHRSGWALVPMVPPGVRGNRVLSAHFILWEVEAWSDIQLGARPDRDPYLLRRVSEDLFAIVGEWDLTDVERAVMRGRRDG